MPIISVKIIKGRTPAQKALLIRELAQATMRSLDAPEASIRVILTEIEAEHWGIGARTKASIEGERSE